MMALVNIPRIPEPYRFISILWVTFLLAIAATGAFFSAFDPEVIRQCLGFPSISRIGAYTVGFFLFWLLTAGSGLISAYFIAPLDAESDK